MTRVIALRRLDETAAAAQVRMAVWDATGRHLADGADPDRQVLAVIESRFPGAVAAYGRAPLLALTRRPGAGVCSWCIVRVLSTTDQQAAHDPSNAAVAALLGKRCATCTARFEAEAVAERERQRVDGLVAAGVPPAVATGSRTPAEAHAKLARIRELERARPPRRLAATGVIWAGPQPAEVTAALQATGYPTPARRRR
jgi:hypothetical protein